MSGEGSEKIETGKARVNATVFFFLVEMVILKYLPTNYLLIT